MPPLLGPQLRAAPAIESAPPICPTLLDTWRETLVGIDPTLTKHTAPVMADMLALYDARDFSPNGASAGDWDLVQIYGLWPKLGGDLGDNPLSLPVGLHTPWHVTCHANCVLQVMFSYPPLRTLLLDTTFDIESPRRDARAVPTDADRAMQLQRVLLTAAIQRLFRAMSRADGGRRILAVDSSPVLDVAAGILEAEVWHQVRPSGGVASGAAQHC